MYEKLTPEQQAGFDYESSITGEPVEDMILRLAGEHGMSYWHDTKRAKLQDIVRKIEVDPDAFVDVIEPIYAAKVAEIAEAVEAKAIEDAKVAEMERP